MSKQQPIDVAIVGGGIAGLCLAIGLLQNPSMKVTIYEAAHHFGEIGAGVALGPSAARSLAKLSPDVYAAYERLATPNADPARDNVWYDLRYGEGEKAGEMFGQTHYNVPGYSGRGGVHRAHFLDELIKLVPDGTAKFGKRLVDITEVESGKVSLKFQDGSEAAHGCVVGCDGIHSSVRKYILGADDPAVTPVFTGKYVHRGLIPMDKVAAEIGEELAVNSQFYPGHHCHLLTFPVSHGKIFNAVAFSGCETWDNPKWVVPGDFKDIQEDFASFRGPGKKIIDMMTGTDIWALFDHLPARTFYKGNVLMIGDAAHATTPHQGSGGGMAIEDAFVLASLLPHVRGPEQVEDCFRAFNELRLERGHKLVSTSRDAGLVWQLEHPDIGEDFVKFRDNKEQRMRWIWEEDLDAEVQNGLKLMAS